MNIKNIAILVGVIALAVLLYFGFNPLLDKATKMIGKMVKQEVNLIMEPYETKSKENERKITALNGKVKKLEGRINENKPPVTSDELRDRFRKLGYTPVK